MANGLTNAQSLTACGYVRKLIPQSQTLFFKVELIEWTTDRRGGDYNVQLISIAKIKTHSRVLCGQVQVCETVCVIYSNQLLAVYSTKTTGPILIKITCYLTYQI